MSWYPGRSAAASTAVRSRTEMTILSGQTLRTWADCTSVMRSTRRATIAALIRMSGVPGRIPASAITSAREMPAGPVTCIERTTRNLDPSSAQATPTRIATAASMKKAAFHGSVRRRRRVPASGAIRSGSVPP